MKKFSIFYMLTYLIGLNTFGQDSKVIELEPVEIVPNDQILVYSNFSKKHRESKGNGLSSLDRVKIAIVSGFSNPEESFIKMEGLEFFSIMIGNRILPVFIFSLLLSGKRMGYLC